jgi:hypothetical protein
MSQPLHVAIAGELAAYEHAYQNGHVSEQASTAMNLLRATVRHLAESDFPHNRVAAREIREALAKADEASE